MAQGPVTIFDKSTIQSFSLDEAVIFDNFYRSNIPPVFLVECLADLERDKRLMKSTPEQLVGALAEKTPDMQASANVFHLDILNGELMGKFDLDLMLLRPVLRRRRFGGGRAKSFSKRNVNMRKAGGLRFHSLILRRCRTGFSKRLALGGSRSRSKTPAN